MPDQSKQQESKHQSRQDSQSQQKEDQSPMVRYHIFVRGRVQGVFYRKHTVQAAKARGVCGYVRNMPDGRVELVAEGRKADVDSLVQWCYVGSPKSAVEGVDVAVMEGNSAECTFTAFDVRH
ncbi:Acylphosphatase-like domain [Trypanosoma melophagium]|uniref:Acylphosphatase-like domain n=1 Tax=Trypanosoma melophagium TaxID=715481 RepID=UPI00351AA71A|nr:Acylphosphatase-like domain [Trypanosoma melophagium]